MRFEKVAKSKRAIDVRVRSTKTERIPGLEGARKPPASGDDQRQCQPGRRAGQYPAPGCERGLVRFGPEHAADPADGAGRRADDVPFPRRIELGRFSLQRGPHLQRRGDRRQHGQLHRLGQRRRAGHDRLRLRQPAGGGGVPRLLERAGRQHDRDRRRARSGATRPMPGRRSTGRRPATGRACGRGSAGPGRRPQLPAPQSPRPVRHPLLGGWQRGVRELGDRPPHRCSTTRPPTSRLPSSSRPSRPRSTRAISIGLDVGSPGDFNNWTANILQQSAKPGAHSRLPERPQLRPGPGSESDSNLLLDTVTDIEQRSIRPRQPVRLGRRERPTTKALLTQYLGARRQKTSSCSRPSSTRFTQNPGKQTTSLVNGLFLADSLGACSRRRTTAPTSGTCAIATQPAATPRRAFTAGARAATTA